MRTIGTGDIEREKRQRSTRNFCIFILVLLVLSSAGYAFLSNPNVDSTNTTTDSGLRQIGDRWVFGQTGREVSLAFSPQDTAHVPVGQLNGLETYLNEPLFFDVTNEGIIVEIGQALRFYPSRVQEACYGSCTRDLPEKDCTENLIVWRDSNSSSVRQENRCVFIEGDMRAADAFIYTLFGIPRENL